MNKPKYYVYVIDLDKSILRKEDDFKLKNPQYKAGKPCVYVGQSSHTPKERFEKHKQGHKAVNQNIRRINYYWE